jgi:hypothetical protein
MGSRRELPNGDPADKRGGPGPLSGPPQTYCALLTSLGFPPASPECEEQEESGGDEDDE